MNSGKARDLSKSPPDVADVKGGMGGTGNAIYPRVKVAA